MKYEREYGNYPFSFSFLNQQENRLMLSRNRTRVTVPPAGERGSGNVARKCLSEVERQCSDGSCISRIELCPEEQLMNQNTILIMIIVGLAIVIFLVILYCFQQRQSRANRQYEMEGEHSDECDHESLNAPPPTYDEVVHTNMYPETPQTRRLRELSEEPSSPMTPPPNYDTALIILAQSEESILCKPHSRQSSVIRRCISVDEIQTRQPQTPVSSSPDVEHKDGRHKSRRIFRFSKHFSRRLSQSNGFKSSTSNINSSQCQSFLITPPPYPLTPPLYPFTPPPPLTPLVVESQESQSSAQTANSLVTDIQATQPLVHIDSKSTEPRLEVTQAVSDLHHEQETCGVASKSNTVTMSTDTGSSSRTPLLKQSNVLKVLSSNECLNTPVQDVL
ncbi:uncharacterized protein LOC128244728 [Mya arenaria]|uniref:uncharacterized protein LOC128244728 n=1 Tax=Mya arenaria TaxID=6604 RepID=UPI0022E824B5|nr:uncharacterized protein LOC128244728 [Mya arenaria]XP_052818739.1 uncharacterized protein LOC128244728 [Mya arenaria]XP_052818740.1 uncharacterized protein LOC128244728 [Mya arenaria]